MALVSIAACSVPQQDTPTAFADIHLHYNYTHDEIMTPHDAVKILRQHNIVLATVSSEPTYFALKLSAAGEGWILPFASPYYKAGNRLNWYFDKHLLEALRERLATGKYRGIGEVHITAGIGPRRDNPVFVGLIKLAEEFSLPFLIHTDSDRHEFFLSICKKYPDVRFIWAHAGGTLQPASLAPLMQQCANVWLDLAGRDPDHYDQLADNDGSLLPDWRNFIIDYQDRIMTGTDPVWNAFQIYRWYEADEGWQHYADFIGFHRRWLATLPPAVQHKIQLHNARLFFDLVDTKTEN